MAEWEATIRDEQRTGSSSGQTLDASGGQKHYLLADGSILAQGYAPTKHATEFVVQHRLERHQGGAARAAQ